MKRLLNSLFVMTQGAWLSQKGENIIVHLNKEESRAFPIHIFDSVLCFGQVSVTPPLMGGVLSMECQSLSSLNMGNFWLRFMVLSVEMSSYAKSNIVYQTHRSAAPASYGAFLRQK